LKRDISFQRSTRRGWESGSDLSVSIHSPFIGALYSWCRDLDEGREVLGEKKNQVGNYRRGSKTRSIEIRGKKKEKKQIQTAGC